MESRGTVPVPALFLNGALGCLFCASSSATRADLRPQLHEMLLHDHHEIGHRSG